MAEDAREVAKLQLLNTTRTLVLDVQNAFVDVLQAKDNLALARENLQAFQGIVERERDAGAGGRSGEGRTGADAGGGAAIPERGAAGGIASCASPATSCKG